jgi:acyl-CoA synthetase (AMP-forming)/AMP-acid ligase II
MVWTGPYPPVEVGGTTLHRMVLAAAARAGDRPALVEGASGTVVPYRLLAERIQGVAAGLAARGFAPGDVLALWAPNLPQWAGVALGAMAAGGTVTGVTPAATERELAAQLADAGASVLVTVPSQVPAARSAAAAAGVRDLVVLGQAEGATPILDLLAAGTSARPPDPAPAPDPAAVALLPYSSGTTGLPKGVELTHANLVTSVRQVASGLRVGDRDTVVIVDRLKELIKVRGHQVAPAELEALLATHPAVADAAVLGREDPDDGEVPVAVVVPRPGADPDPEDLLAWVAERVAPHKRIRDLEFIDQIPKSASGKILRRVLIDREKAR